MKFRYDINALRALAVTAVVLFHYKVDFVPGGFVGVDVFFVISGYLMTSIIMGRLAKGKFSIWDFYYDRAKRIVPRSPWHVLCPARGRLLFAGTGNLSLPWFYIDCRAPLLFEFSVLGSNRLFRCAKRHQMAPAYLEPFGGMAVLYGLSDPSHGTSQIREDATLYRSNSLGLLQFCHVLLCIWFSQEDPIAIFYLYPQRAVGLLLAPAKGVGIARGRDRRLAIPE